ncbi:MAG: hypothetical protein EHM23_08105 [Acidobacteria bacterium]|nr:MAG: hypothetical protein EHM23_08105 [Acidobacteriota bacterium]
MTYSWKRSPKAGTRLTSLLFGVFLAAVAGTGYLLTAGQGSGPVTLTEDAVDDSAGNLPAFRIETASAAYYLEKTGAGLSSMVDRDGNDWLAFHPEAGSRAGGEFRGFPNAVHQQAGNYFHPKNSGTDTSSTQIERVTRERVTISALSGNGLWRCRYDFHPSWCTFTMTGMPSDKKYWVLYEGTPGGHYEDDDWWMTSESEKHNSLAVSRDGDIPDLEWIAFGDPKLNRAVLLVHHEDDSHPDRYYGMDGQMTVFGFGRKGLTKYLDRTPQRFSIAFVESRNYADISAMARRILAVP